MKELENNIEINILKEINKEILYNLYINPLSHRINKSLNHKSINSKNFNIGNISKENENIITDLNNEKIFENNIIQIKIKIMNLKKIKKIKKVHLMK